MHFEEAVEAVALGFEIVGIAIITIGGAIAMLRAIFARSPGDSYYQAAREGFGRPLLLGLEVLVAADIIETVTVDRTLENVASLGLLVLIRVVLSFSLEVEIDGIVPWRKAQLASRREAAAAAAKAGETKRI